MSEDVPESEIVANVLTVDRHFVTDGLEEGVTRLQDSCQR